MLASAKELGLGDASGGILELPADAPVGQPLRAYLQLDEAVLDVNVTPNRGDAMSVIGMAREVAALTGTKVTGPAASESVPAHNERFPVQLEAPAACPRFVGCIVRGINNHATAPVWLRERLRRAGMRSISPVVDVTNYVMLELGQPMHAYDLGKLKGGIWARMARAGESFTLLDGKAITAEPDDARDRGRRGAGGAGRHHGRPAHRRSRPRPRTCCWSRRSFHPRRCSVARAASACVTDASQRFERGVDPTQQVRAMERALALLHSIAGGAAGPIDVTESAAHLPRRSAVPLRASRLTRLPGRGRAARHAWPARLPRCRCRSRRHDGGWQVTPPAVPL